MKWLKNYLKNKKRRAKVRKFFIDALILQLKKVGPEIMKGYGIDFTRDDYEYMKKVVKRIAKLFKVEVDWNEVL